MQLAALRQGIRQQVLQDLLTRCNQLRDQAQLGEHLTRELLALLEANARTLAAGNRRNDLGEIQIFSGGWREL